MKKFLAFILAVVYLSTSIAAVKAGSACPECRDNQKAGNCCLKVIKADCCKNELTQIKADEHHRTSVGAYKLNPFFPATITSFSGLPGELISEALHSSFYSITVFADGIPLFVRHCNFRI
ncbi:MAG TPA: hypothetical protein VHC48_22780 [Puia sp.]|nr:hypothetical protein [Puia sp.]